MPTPSEQSLSDGFLLNDAEVRPAARQIVRDGEIYRVHAKSMAVLICLARHGTTLVSKQDLIEQAWEYHKPLHSALTHAISELRNALGDNPAAPKYIATIRGQGYRLLTPPGALDNEPKPGGFAFDGEQGDNSGNWFQGAIAFAKKSRLINISAAFVLAIWVLIQILEVLLPIFALPPWILQLTVLIFSVGFPIYILACWYVDLRRKRRYLKQLPASEEKTSLRRQIAFEFVFIVVISGTVLFLATHLKQVVEMEADTDQLLVLNPRSKIPSNSFAVLPLVAAQQQPIPAHIVRGFQGELIRGLSQLEGISVASERASRGVKSDEALSAIRDRLGVHYLIEGELVWEQEQPGVRLSITDTDSGLQIWHEQLGVDRDNLLASYNTLAKKLINAIKLFVPGVQQASEVSISTDNFVAYDKFIQANEIMRAADKHSDYQKASNLLLQALDADSNFAEASSALCMSYLRAYETSKEPQLYQLAVQACQHTLQFKQAGASPYSALGKLYRHSGNYEESEEQFLLALDQDPFYPLALMGYSELLVDLGRIDEAETMIRQAIAVEPGFWKNYDSYGRLLFIVGRYHAAALQYERVTALKPDSASAYNGLGAAYYLHGDFPKATQAWSMALSIEQNEHAYSNLGTALYYDGHFDEAAKMYEKAVDISPRSYTIVGNLADALKYSDPDAARPVYQRALTLAREIEQINAKDVFLRAQISRFLAELNRCEESREYQTKLLQEELADPYIYYDLAVAEIVCGDEQSVLDKLSASLAHGYPSKLLLADHQFRGYREAIKTALLTTQ